MPEYFARMACLRARRAARETSSDDTISASSSSSSSGLGLSGEAICGAGACSGVREGGLAGERGDILGAVRQDNDRLERVLTRLLLCPSRAFAAVEGDH